MTKDRASHGFLSRRQLLQGAVGTAALVSAFPPLHAAGADTLPQNAKPRIRDTFDFGWKFQRGDHSGAQLPEFSDSRWKNVDLPHDWSIEGPFDEKEPSSSCGAYLPTGMGWYRKRFMLPELHKNRVLTIEFDGVYQNSEVWINGKYLGKRPYGFVPFYYDLTPHVMFGRENVMSVKVDNSRQTNCRWYSGSGIYRRAWLLSTDKIHVDLWGTSVSTPKVNANAATIQVITKIKNDGATPAHCTLTTGIFAGHRQSLPPVEATQLISPGDEHEFIQRLEVAHPHLWSVSDPHLYQLRGQIRVQGRVVDECETTFGIRDAVFDANKGFLLNGERLKLNGVCLHHDGGCLGAAVPERVWERRLEILREMGCNAIRTSHNPPAAEFLDLCDRLGFLVMNEAFDEWKVPKGQIGPYGYSNYFDEWYERDVQNFVRRDRNHPSVILWSAGNEVGDQAESRGAETLKKLLAAFRAEDPTRPVTVGCDHIASEPPSSVATPEFLALLDVVGYNYVDRWRDRREKYYSLDREAFPQRRMIGTESEAIGGVRGEYRQLFADDTSGGLLLPLRARNIDVEQLWKFVDTYDYVAGDFMWTGIDHLGEARWPMKGSFTGVLDTCGFKKDGFYFYQSQWTAKPVLHLFPHWNWKGQEGQTVVVTCYTNCDTVELFLNNRSCGVKGFSFPRPGMEGEYGKYPARAKVARTTADLHLSWDVRYEAGTLRAVGIKNGQIVSIVEVATTGEPATVNLLADRRIITANGRDVAHITVQILDAKSRLVLHANNEVNLVVEGPGTLIGVDNGDPMGHDSFQSTRVKAFNGLCLAVIQSQDHSGKIRVTASSPTLAATSVTFNSQT